MAQKGSAARIGAFVLGGVLLIVAGVIAFGSGAFLRDAALRAAVMGESLQGLQIGAPVTYNGVQVGEVVRIGAVLSMDEGSIANGVVFRLHGGAIVADRAGSSVAEIADALIERGMRVQLGLQSFVTGALYLRLVFDKEAEVYPAPATFMGAPTVPAVRSEMARFSALADTLGRDLPALIDRIGALADSVALVLSPQNTEAISAALTSMAGFAASLDQTGAALPETLASLRMAADHIAAAAARADSAVADNAEGLQNAMTGLTEAVAAATRTAEELRAAVRENRAGLRAFTSEGLAEITAAAAQAQAMARAVERVARRLDNEGAGFLLNTEAVREYTPRATRPR